jgi:hypothetical protein
MLRFARSSLCLATLLTVACDGESHAHHQDVDPAHTGDGGDVGNDQDADIAPAPDSGTPELGIEDWLAAQDDLTFKKGETKVKGYTRYDVTIRQPADHDHPGGASFTERIVLHHFDKAAPVVLATTGYDVPADEWLMEPTTELNANQLLVEHRYFPPSIPDKADWKLLNIRQAAGDSHHIVERFKDFYSGHWINTGASKGGMTAVFHRRFYPDDVDGTVGYVTPISFGAPDNRYIPFLQAINPDGCGDDVHSFQRLLITDRAKYGTQLRTTLGHAADFKTDQDAQDFVVTTAAGFDWSFWQFYGYDYCKSVKQALTSDDAAGQILDYEARLTSYIGTLWAYDYQAYNELGFPGQSYDTVADLLQNIDVNWGGDNQTPPWGMANPQYVPAAMQDIAAWLAKDARDMLFIYGEFDPWTAGKVDLGTSRDVLEVIAPHASHSAEISMLAEADREKALDLMYGWAGLERPKAPHVVLARKTTALDPTRLHGALPPPARLLRSAR